MVLYYEQFKVALAKDKCKLTVGRFQGTTTDPMVQHNEMNFTTKDSDNDQLGRNCALCYGLSAPIGGWWFKNCWAVAPNIFYNHWEGIYLKGRAHSLPFIEIKIRPQDLTSNGS